MSVAVRPSRHRFAARLDSYVRCRRYTVAIAPFAALELEAFTALEEIGRKAWKEVQALE